MEGAAQEGGREAAVWVKLRAYICGWRMLHVNCNDADVDLLMHLYSQPMTRKDKYGIGCEYKCISCLLHALICFYCLLAACNM